MKATTLNRRDFLTASSAAALTAALIQKADAAPVGAAGEWRNKQSGMAYRRLGRTGFMVSEIVMGGNRIAPDNYEHILYAMDLGLNYLDTAPAYGRGASERGYARVIQARKRDTFFLNTKVSAFDGNRNKLYQEIFASLPASEQAKMRSLAKEEIERRHAADPDYLGGYFPGQARALEAAALSNVMSKKYRDRIDREKNYKQLVLDSIDQSLRRLGTDHLDIMTCPHGACTPFEILNYPEMFEAFEILKKQGKVRRLSVSAHTDPAGILEAAMEAGVYSLAMVAYNIVNHRYVDKALEKAKKNDFGVIAMKVARPVHNGRNNGTIDPPERVKLIQDAMPGPLKVPQKAYLWDLRNPNLSAVISEMITLDMVKDNLPLARTKG
jgi:aryl-alcohol dehydrogenase-like predicted oxidoreductase